MLREQVQGAWKLVSWVFVDDETGKESYPFGPDATGIIMYTGDGYMSAQIMTPGRAEYDLPDFDGGTQAQAAGAASGYLAYSGPYEVDEEASELRHHLDVSLLPNWLNSVQLRHAVLDGDRLTLSAELPGTTLRTTLVWRRPAKPDDQTPDKG
jgi:hypothetical protein